MPLADDAAGALLRAPDFLEEAEPDAPSNDKLAAVLALAEQLVNERLAVADLETRLTAAKQRAYDLEHKTLPDAMDVAGMDHIGLPELGYDIKIKPWFEGKLPPTDKPVERQKAIEWLTESGHGDLLTSTVSIHFGRSEHDLAQKVKANIEDWLNEQGYSNIVALSSAVHYMTYKAFLREQTEAGTVLPLDVLNAHVGRIAKMEKRETD